MLQEQHDGGQFQSSANVAFRGRGDKTNRGCGNFCGQGGGGRNNGGQGGSSSGSAQGGQGTSKPRCQICDKPNHSALE